MYIRSTVNLWHFLLPLLLAGALTSCEENITDSGRVFLRDSVFTGSQTFGDLFTASNLTKQTLNAQGVKYNVNYESPYLFCGIVPDESLEAWSILKIPFIHDSLGTINKISLKLSMRYRFVYGSSAENVEFTVYTESKKLITEATASLALSDLDPEPVGTFQGMITSDSTTGIEVTLDSARLAPLLRTTGLSLVIVPNPAMKNIRAFASNEIGADIERPDLAVTFSKSNPDTSYTLAIFPSYDFSVITDKRVDAAGEFTIRGAAARRERFTLDIKSIRSRLSLDPYSTINNALLQLQLVSNTTSVTPIDTAKPVVVEIAAPAVEDSAERLFAYATRDESESNALNFQLRTLIEQAIRRNQDSLVIEVRTGFADNRIFSSRTIGVEDYHLNRWTFFDMSAADSLKRPRLALTYSYLR